MSILNVHKLILSDCNENHNKYWSVSLTDSNEVITEWGRIGDTLQSKTKTFDSLNTAERFINNKINEKKKKGYTELSILNGTETIVVNHNQSSLNDIAQKQIVSDDETKKLITKLAEANVHNILSSTTLTFSQDTGLFATPLGIVTDTSINSARIILNKMSNFVSKSDFNNNEYIDLLNKYLRLIPQKVSRRLNTELYANLDAIKAQNDIIDSLEVSFQQSLTEINKQNGESNVSQPQVFACEIKSMLDQNIIDRIDKKYKSTLQSMHSSSSLKVKKVYTVRIEKQYNDFILHGSKLGNIQELWHGTKTSNLLSILKSGLIVPPKGNPNVTGRMFGDYIYFSDQSTKSLNYSYGYWSGNKNNNCYMLLAQVAMGKSYTPTHCINEIPIGYDSIFAKGGYSGVQNNEMIIRSINQANLTYLVEFDR